MIDIVILCMFIVIINYFYLISILIFTYEKSFSM